MDFFLPLDHDALIFVTWIAMAGFTSTEQTIQWKAQ